MTTYNQEGVVRDILSTHIFPLCISIGKGSMFKAFRSLSKWWNSYVANKHPNGDVIFADHTQTLVSKFDCNVNVDTSYIRVSNYEVVLMKECSRETISSIIEKEWVLIKGVRLWDVYWNVIEKYISDHQITQSTQEVSALSLLINLIDDGIIVPESIKSYIIGCLIMNIEYSNAVNYILIGLPEDLTLSNKQIVLSSPNLTSSQLKKYSAQFQFLGIRELFLDFEWGTIRIEELVNSQGEWIEELNCISNKDDILSSYCEYSPHTPPKWLWGEYAHYIINNEKLSWVDVEEVWGLWSCNVDYFVINRVGIPLEIMKTKPFSECSKHNSVRCKKCMYRYARYTWKDISKKKYVLYKEYIFKNTFGK